MIDFIKKNSIYSLLILFGAISFWGSLIYWFYALDTVGVILNLVLSVATFIIILKYSARNRDSAPAVPSNSGSSIWVLSLLYLGAWSGSVYLLLSARTSESIISPWVPVSEWFFVFFFIAAVILFILILNKGITAKALLHLHTFLMFAVAVLVYQVGYGFDPFIHEATLEVIKEKGAVTPKPLYYVGQYSLVITLYKITPLSLAALNKFLVPVAGALFLPEVLYRGFKTELNSRRTLLILFFLPVLTFSPFIITVPQNLSYIFFISVLALGATAHNKTDLSVVGILALTTFFIHPISGIPALLFFAGLVIFKIPGVKILKLSKKFYYIAILALSAISLPMAFSYGAKADIVPFDITSILPAAEFYGASQEDLILNFVYFYGLNLKIILALMIVAGMILGYLYRRRYPGLMLYFYPGAGLVLAYLICKGILDFNFLIDYEKNNYSQRLLTLSVLFFLPFIVLAFSRLLSRIRRQEKAIQIPFVVIALLLLPASLYLSYPRADNYHNSHFHSVGKTDLQAVQWIEQDADKDYIVLANQQVSAAALKKIGFHRYYKNDIYFYPIPTGGQLYQYYLDMVYEEPTQKTMAEAMEFAGVDKGYFVLNKYWWAFDKIKQEAKLEAQNWKKLNQGKIYIFEYNR